MVPPSIEISSSEQTGKRNVVIFLTMAYVMFQLQAVQYDLGIKIRLIDLTYLVGYLYFILFMLRRSSLKSGIPMLYIPIILYCLFILWCGFSYYIAMQPERAFTLYLQIVRNLFVFLLLMLISVTPHDVKKVNIYIFFIGILFSIVAATIYYKSYLNLDIIKKDSLLWEGIGYDLDKSGYLRANGLVGDSNFFSVFMCLSLLCGFNIKTKRIIKYSGLIIIMVSILLSFSRTMYLVLILSFVVMFILKLSEMSPKKYLLIAAVTSLAICAMYIFLRINPVTVMKLRFSEFGLTGTREYIWTTLFPLLSNFKIIWGYGLRASESATGGMYAHNTYLEVAIDTGLIGFAIFFMILVSPIIIAWQFRMNSKAHDSIIAPWIQTLIILMLFSFFFSFGSNPFVWYVIGVIIAYYKNRGAGNDKRNALSKFNYWIKW